MVEKVLTIYLLWSLWVTGTEIVNYKFWQDSGEMFPDHSGNQNWAVNGSSHENTDSNVYVSVNRGIYIRNDMKNFVIGPPNTKSTNDIALGTTFSIGCIVQDTNIRSGRPEPFVVTYGRSWADGDDSYLFSFGFKDKYKVKMRAYLDGDYESQDESADEHGQKWEFIKFTLQVTSGETDIRLYLNEELLIVETYGDAFVDAPGNTLNFGSEEDKNNKFFVGFIHSCSVQNTWESTFSEYIELGAVCETAPWFYEGGTMPQGGTMVEPPVCSDIGYTSDCAEVCQCHNWQLGRDEWDPWATCSTQACNYSFPAAANATSWVVGWDSSCDTWSGPNNNQCLTCPAGSYLHPSTGSGSTWDTSWPTGYYGENDGLCTLCWETCTTCVGQGLHECTSCQDGNAETANPGTWRCKSDYYDEDPEDPLDWRGCDPACATCNQASNDDCITCAWGFFLQPGTSSCRSTCPTQFYGASGGLCDGCDVTWETCSGAEAIDWETCKDANAAIVVVPGACVCVGNYYENTSGTGLQWIECVAEWATCTAGTNDDCQSCAASYYLQPGSSSCRSTWPINTFANSANGVCDPCRPSWETWSGPDSHECLTCPSGQFLHPPIDAPSTWESAWPAGFYGESSDQTCMPCYPTCADCQGSLITDCTRCADANALIANDGWGEWLCMNHYADADPTDVMSWIQCATEWDLCTADTNDDCTSWTDTYYLQPSSNSCRDTWPSGTFPNTSSHACQQCHPNWATCYDSRGVECLSWQDPYAEIVLPGTWVCKDGYVDTGSQHVVTCTLCDAAWDNCTGTTDDDCVAWADGYYNKATLPDCKCRACATGWATWDGSSKYHCLTCANGFASQPDLPTAWFDTCPDGYYILVNLCEPWDEAWLTCFSYSNIHCNDCSPGYFLQPLQATLWSSTWPQGYYSDSDRIWQACDPACVNCSGSLSNECTECATYEIVESGTCICADGYFSATKSPLDCKPCYSTWKTCFGLGENEWYSCAAENAIPVNGKCEWESPFSESAKNPLTCKGCPANSRYNSQTQTWETECPGNNYVSNYECYHCPQNWSTCASASQCTSCPAGYFLTPNYTCEQCDVLCLTCENYAEFCNSCINNLELEENQWGCGDGKLLDEANSNWIDPIKVQVTVGSDNKIRISFQESPGTALTKEDLQFIFFGSTGAKIDMNWDLTEIDLQNYEVVLQSDDAIEEGTKINMELSEEFVSNGNVDPGMAITTETLNKEQSSDEKEDAQKQEAAAEATSAGSSSAVSAAALASVASSNLGALWKILNYL